MSVRRYRAWIIALAGALLVAATAWLLLVPRAFASQPSGEVWTDDQLTTAIQAGELEALALTNDAHGDVVARTKDGTLVVYRPSPQLTGAGKSPQQILVAIDAAGQSDILTAAGSDPELAAYSRTVAAIPPRDMTIPLVLWLVSLVAFLGMLMWWLAARTSFRFSQPAGTPFGVGTDRSP